MTQCEKILAGRFGHDDALQICRFIFLRIIEARAIVHYKIFF